MDSLESFLDWAARHDALSFNLSDAKETLRATLENGEYIPVSGTGILQRPVYLPFWSFETSGGEDVHVYAGGNTHRSRILQIL